MTFLFAAFGLAIDLGITVALCWWGALVGRARGGAWRHLVWLPIVGMMLGGCGLGLTVGGLVHAFGSVEGADPAAKAQLLSEGISHAMRATLVFAPMSAAVYVASVMGCVIGTATSRSAQR